MAVIKSRRSGVWDDPHTWAGNRVPRSGDSVIIRSGHEVTPTAKTRFKGGTVQIEDGAIFNITKAGVRLGLRGGVSPAGSGGARRVLPTRED